ncbi:MULTISPECIES: HEAT repeat domain-containing protein [Methylosinus]|uniref:HEAT repeat domain-containing protein n=1 Tax=Methylosinus TaxID=425 RepID=UPI00313809FA
MAVLEARGTRDVFDAAIELSRSCDPKSRRLGVTILGQLGSPTRTFPEECCDALLEIIRCEQDRDVLITTVFALGHLGNRRCEDTLIELRNSSDDEIRHGVAFALCGATSDAAVGALLELMSDPYEKARDWATTSIGQTVSIDGPEIRDALLRRANDADVFVSAEALHGLARRRDDRVTPYLIAEISAPGEHGHLFADAARSYLRLDGDRAFDSEALARMLRLPNKSGSV